MSYGQNGKILIGNSPERPWEFLTYLVYFWHNVWTRNVRNLIKGSKDAYFTQESKILRATILARGSDDDVI